jgi:hypothetical protein
VQTLVDWRLGECGNKFVGVCTEANSVKGAEAAELQAVHFIPSVSNYI